LCDYAVILSELGFNLESKLRSVTGSSWGSSDTRCDAADDQVDCNYSYQNAAPLQHVKHGSRLVANCRAQRIVGLWNVNSISYGCIYRQLLPRYPCCMRGCNVATSWLDCGPFVASFVQYVNSDDVYTGLLQLSFERIALCW